uniref:Uncharacterized protein n=1 Tax=Amphimedon queenslandica TaxID=400682 RepID=A0A1X7UJS3_AMPQE
MQPIYHDIVNLPQVIQFREDNTVICGIWVKKSKRDMGVLLYFTLAFIDRLHIWFDFIDAANGRKCTMRIKLLFAVVDLVEKAKVLNMAQFNGYYDCPT